MLPSSARSPPPASAPHLPHPSPFPSHLPLLRFILPHLLSVRATVYVTQTLPLFLPFLYYGIFLSPLPSPLSSLSITLSVIDGGAGRQPGKKVLRICPFRRLLPLSRPSCLSARPRRCSSYLFPCKPPLSPPPLTLPSLRVSRARPVVAAMTP